MNTAEIPFRELQVCVLTFLRPEMLAEALFSLQEQRDLQKLHLHLRVLVVDNDAAQSGRDSFNAFLAQTSLNIRYVCEPSRGLSAARNRALNESREMDLLAFLDDDEVADPHWLFHMVTALDTHLADVVAGPVQPHYGASPAWIQRGKFFHPAQRETGDTVSHIATDNVLMRNSVFNTFQFDSRFDATGGEDTHYFLRVARYEFRSIWARKGAVWTHIPPNRANARWLIRRAYSDASRYTKACLALDPKAHTWVLRAIKAAGGLLSGLVLLPRFVFGREHGVYAVRLIARAAGTTSALFGRSKSYYGESHG